MARHLISIHDLTAEEVAGLFRLAVDVKANPEKYAEALKRKSLAMIFEKSSTRTRVSFEVGMVQMGGFMLIGSFDNAKLRKGMKVMMDRCGVSDATPFYHFTPEK